ncbi:MAG: hypothetical protein GC179_22295 [Anaerolineaceae bacterium]|nr:hypothetical protein [Anaerolineaceae bacterium]
MRTIIRRLMFVYCAAQALFALAFILQLPLVTNLWPLPYTGSMSFIFIASMFLAAAASTFWCIYYREYGALAGIALDYLVIFGPLCIYALQLNADHPNSKMMFFVVACAVGVIAGLVLLWWSIRIPISQSPPMPRVAKFAFIIFVVALLIFGGQMVLKVPNLLPWDISLVGSALYGWMFLGAAVYFLYGLIRPGWSNTGGQLAGFLGYDLVLIVPFLQMLPTISATRRTSLIIYLVVVISSGLLSIYYLFLRRVKASSSQAELESVKP